MNGPGPFLSLIIIIPTWVYMPWWAALIVTLAITYCYDPSAPETP